MWGKAYDASRYIDRANGRPIGATNYSEVGFGCITALALFGIIIAIILTIL